MSKLIKMQAMLLIPAVFSGVLNAAEFTTVEDQYSYALGYRLGKMLQAQGIGEIESAAFAEGMSDLLSGSTPQLDQATRATALTEMNKIKQQKAAEKAKVKIAEGEAFLAENAKKKGVVTLESGLQYKITESGDANGISPKLTEKVEVHYEGQLIDGTVFDSSIKRGKPAQFSLGGVIAGFKEALSLMKPGDKWRIYVPSELGYGVRGAGKNIGPNETLIFDMHLIKTVK